MLLVVDPQILNEINENERDILITIYYQSVLAIFNFFYMKRNFATKQDEIGIGKNPISIMLVSHLVSQIWMQT
jgi:hypothetical protein